MKRTKPKRLMNYGSGDLFNFHGAFTELKDALAKEKSVPGAFIRDVYYRGGPRFGVLTKNPKARKRNVEWGTYEKGVFHPWTRRPKTRRKKAVRQRNVRRKGTRKCRVCGGTFNAALVRGGICEACRAHPLTKKRNLSPVLALEGLSNLKSLGFFDKKRRKAKRRNADDTKLVTQALHKLFPGKTAQQLTMAQLSQVIRAAQDLKAGKPITRRGNPTKRNYADATDLYTQFHGRGPRRVTDTRLPVKDYDGHEELGQLGKMVSITIGGSGWRKKIEWGAREAPDLASEPDGKQLYIVGGSQNLDSGLAALPVKTDRHMIDLGFAYQVEYFSQKRFDGFQPVTYYHAFGEDTGERPRVVYDRRKKRIHLVGGAYKVKPEGIVN